MNKRKIIIVVIIFAVVLAFLNLQTIRKFMKDNLPSEVKIFEKYSQTRVYGFDWFQGMKPGENDDMAHKNKYGANSR